VALDQAEEGTPAISSVEDAAQAVSALEGDLVTAESRAQFDALFKRAQALSKQFETDESLGAQERAAVEQHVRDVLKRARVDYDRNRARAEAALAASAERLALSLETLTEADTIPAVQEVRADLRLIRESLQAASVWASRDAEARTWHLWQTANQTAWNTLNECWKRNELALAALLDRAEAEMERGNPRGAKMQIKQFHEQTKIAECSHASTKMLRVRANALWDRATVLSKEQHDAYIVIARKRLDYMRRLLMRAEQNRQRVESDVSSLEVDLQQAQTDVAAALLRGQLEGRRKELRRLQTETAGLLQRISETEKVVT
jgi:hypothetical protein